jgi:thiopurine S-methyltransferase
VDADFWYERWRRGEIGFHQTAYHPGLARWWPTLQLAAGSRVLVPLCGKSLDMAWLREQGHVVAGVELSAIAVDSFFAERGLVPTRSSRGALEKWAAGAYEIWCGDYFDLTPEALGPVSGVYDRAAFHALPPEMRGRYAAHLASLVPAGARGLLVTLEYLQHEMNGPPFAVDQAELERGLGRRFSISELQGEELLGANPKFRDRGLTSLVEHIYRLERLP